eukprot:scaffold23206_cov82-Phaeocystis_antarctica.AAC.2
MSATTIDAMLAARAALPPYHTARCSAPTTTIAPPAAGCVLAEASASRHTVSYRCSWRCSACARSTRVRKPSSCALPTPSPLPSTTSAAFVPDADATAHSTPAAGPRISTPSTANGSLQLNRAVEVGRVHLRARQRGAPPQPRRRLATALPRHLQHAERGAVLQPGGRERSVERRGVGHVAAPLPRRRQPERPPRRRIRIRPLPAAVHHCRRLATAAAHLERAAIEQRALHPRRAPRLQRQRLQEEHATQRRARRRGRGHAGACRARRLQVGRARDDDAPTHNVVGHQRVQRAGHGRTEEGRAARGGRQPMLQQRVDRIDPQEGAPAEAEHCRAAHYARRSALARRRKVMSGISQQRVGNRAAVPKRRHTTQTKQVLFLHRRQLHRPKGRLPSPSSGGRHHWVEDKELRVARSCAA